MGVKKKSTWVKLATIGGTSLNRALSIPKKMLIHTPLSGVEN